MPGTEGEHSVDGRRTAGGRTGNRLLAHDEAEGGNRHGFEHRTHDMKNAFRREGSQQSRDIQGNIDGGNDEIEAPSDFLQLDVAFGVVDVVRTEFAGFRLLAIARGESVDFAAPSVGKLQRHVAQPADADNSDPRVRRKRMLKQRRKDRDAATKERPRGRRIKRIGQWTSPRPLDAQPIREGAGAVDNRALTTRTEMVIA